MESNSYVDCGYSEDKWVKDPLLRVWKPNLKKSNFKQKIQKFNTFHH